MAQRLGPLGEGLWIPETDGVGVDPASPVQYIMPLSAVDGFKTDQPRQAAKIYDGTREAKGSVKGMITAAGDLPVSLDFRFQGLPAMSFFGHDVYSRVGSLHRWIGVGTPESFQFQRKHQQSPALYNRNKALFLNQMKCDQQMSGQNMLTLSAMGFGREVYTDVGGSTTSYRPFVAYNYFDGSILKDGVSLLGVTAFNATDNNNMSRQDAAFLGGQAAGINAGIYDAQGDLGLIYDTDSGDTFYLQAINDTICSIVCLWANKPLSGGPTMFLRRIWPAVLFSRGSVPAGGDAGLMQTQHWVAQVPTADWPAEAFGTTIGPWTIPSSSNFGVKIDGGSTITVAIAAGSKTAAQIATLLNADSTFTAAAVASDFNGRLSVKSKSTVAGTSKVQYDTAVSGSIHALLGFTATIFSGYVAASQYTELYNDLAADYPHTA